MSDAKKKKAQPARPKLQTPAPKKRTPVKRKAEHADAIRSVTPPTSPSPLKKYRYISHGAIWTIVLGIAGYLARTLRIWAISA